MLKQVDAGAPMHAAAPVLPEQRLSPDAERVEKDADLARLFGRAAIPLTLLTERTGAAPVDAGSVPDTQASIGFSALLMRGPCLVCWATKRCIRLESKILASKATGLPCGTHALRGAEPEAGAQCGEGGGRAGANSGVRNGCGLSG